MILFKRAFLTIIFFVFYVFGVAQKNTDGLFLYKTWLYLEQQNYNGSDVSGFPIKDSSVFSLFMNNINLSLDTLKCTGFSKDYYFLSLNTNKDSGYKNCAVFYDRKTKFLKYLSVPVFCSRYVLCINKLTGVSYRIQGFSGNDFLNLFNDVKTEYFNATYKTLKIKTFLRQYDVAGIDFSCIYKGLLSGDVRNFKKFPCLFMCQGSKEMIWIE